MVTLGLFTFFTSAQGQQTMKQTQYFLNSVGDCTSSNFLYDVTNVKSNCSVETTCATLAIYPTYKTINKCTTVLPNEENSPGHVIISTYDSITCNASDLSTVTRIKLGVCYYNGYFSTRYESCSKITTFYDNYCSMGPTTFSAVFNACSGKKIVVCSNTTHVDSSSPVIVANSSSSPSKPRQSLGAAVVNWITTKRH